MSTSAIIKIDGLEMSNIAIYKHHDGYPESTLPWLESFNKKFNEQRGHDPEYKFAQCLRSSSSDQKEFGLCSSEATGWGVVNAARYDADYTYLLNGDGSVTVSRG